MIEQAFYTLMTGTPAITAFVSTRIHEGARPENETGAALVFQRISTVPVVALSGESGLDAVRLQVACIAATHADSHALAQLVRTAVRDGGLVKGVPVMEINDTDEATGIKRTLLDFNLWQ
jgi:hypothetical protein